jgi:nicotinamide-nucleotide amidase
MWRTATQTDAFQRAIAGATVYRREIVRLFGLPESEIANTLRAAEQANLRLDDLEITTCLRRGEIEISTRYEPPAQAAYEALIDFVAERHGRQLFSRDGSTIDEQVAALLGERTVAVGESCTGGLMAARLTERAGASSYFAGGVVAYSNEAKVALLGVDPGTLERHGAVSTEVAQELAEGALRRLGAAFGIGITGIAGPDGGTEDKPVGTVCFCVCAAEGAHLTRRALLPGARSDVRDRASTVALHMLARLLAGERD